ncbi:MAG: tail fiber domain-containing protein [Roseiflexaceae bacterium]
MRTVHVLLATLVVLVLLSGTNVSTATRQVSQGGPVADMTISTTKIRWQPRAPNAGLTLTIAAPDGTVARQAFEPNIAATLSIEGAGGQPRPDGVYTYELRAIPILDEAVRAQLAAVGEADRDALVAQLRQSGALPADLVQAGHFQIAGGAFVLPITGPEPASDGGITPQDVVTADDQIVQGSLCVGFDCVDNESFGFDTIRLKENNTRIGFNDTSVGAFPSNDWQLTANDTASGGANKFSIDDITGAKTPFTIIAGAPTDSLFVGSTGNVGLGTATPVLDLHMLTGDTPAIRLEQSGASGFTPQTWDMAGNEANFFVRDVTGGSRLPFRIRPGAPTSSVDIAASGNVGIGTASPQQRLHVNGNTQIDGSLQVKGSVQVEGRVTELSDMHAKQDFAAVDGQLVLLRLRGVPILTWRYRADASGVRHMGPTAQDFFAAFGLGQDERHIAPLDANGVTLAAVQELDRMVQARDAQIATLERQNADLSERLARLEAIVADLDAK